MKTYNGNVEVNKENAKEWAVKLKDFTKIDGYVRAEQGASITLPVVRQTGDVIAEQGASITLPVVRQTGDVIAAQGASITLPVVKQTGYVIAAQGASITLPVVKQTGYVRAAQGASITLPVVKQTGDVIAAQGASITLPVVKQTGDVRAEQGASITLPVVKQTGDVRAAQGASITLPVVRQTGDVRAAQGASISMPEIAKTPNIKLRATLREELAEEFAEEGYLSADGILSKLVSRKKIKQILAYKVKTLGLGKVQYVVQKGDIFSHGETMKQAKEDLRYKLGGDRDTTFCANWKMDSVHSVDELIRAYRAITGACSTGTKMWCEGQTLPESISVKVAIEKTKGAYGADGFAAFFTGVK